MALQGNRHIIGLAFLYSILFIYGTHAACPSFSGKLKGLEHNVAGSFVIADDCTLKANQFTYDGGAPAVYWWAAPDCNAATIKKLGERISDTRIAKAYSNGELSVSLYNNIDWSKVGCILLYCEEFYADLGHSPITQSLSVPSPATTAPTPSSSSPSISAAAAPPPMETVDSLPSCMELLPGYFNLHWSLNNDNTVTLGLEGRPGSGNFWLGFGFSSPQATAPVMIGSNVVIGGFINGQCFAYNYELTSKSQCDFSTGDGVCPDFAGKQPLVPSTSAKLISCQQTGDKINVVINRPLTASDGLQNAWPSDGSQYSIFAMGPVSEGSNATIPVVLYHMLQLPGTPSPTSVTSITRDPIKLNFSSSQQNCRDIVPLLSAGPSAAPAPARTPVATIDGPTKFTVTIGSNKNYPNPPAWGYSLWINGQESPVVVVRRGTTYTFKIEAGPTHPVYITTSIIGGGFLVDFQDETIFAGNMTTFGTPSKPTTYTWTPNDATPDIVYYQCAVHQKLGWQIQVVDAGTPSIVSAAAPQSSTTPAFAAMTGATNTGCLMTINGKVLSYEACIPVTDIGSNYHLAWNLVPLPSDAVNAYELDMAMNSTTDGYVAVGFPTTPQQMVGSIAMVLEACPSCSTGANISQYSLNAQSQSGVVPTSELGATDTAASAMNGVITGRFKVMLPRANRRRMRALHGNAAAIPQLSGSPSEFPLIFSAGGISSTGQLQQHTTRGYASIDLTAALSDAGDRLTGNVVGGTVNPTARLAHMWLMAISFGVFMPVAILIAYLFPPSQHPWSFQVHRALQTLAFAMACGGIAAAFVGVGGWNTVPAYSIHRDIGITVIVLAFVMVLSLVWRPALDSKIRKWWSLGHRWLGRCTAALAIANIYYGIIRIGQLDAWAWAVYTAILGIILILALGKNFIVKKEVDVVNEKKEPSSV